MKKILVILGMFSALINGATAGFNNWDYKIEDDPFSGGMSIIAINMGSIRSGVALLCKSTEKNIKIRSILGFVYERELAHIVPEMKIAIDGKIILTDLAGHTGSVGDNLAISEVTLEGSDARKFLTAFKNATRQIAIEDGISNGPQLMNARGSTRTGIAFEKCLSN